MILKMMVEINISFKRGKVIMPKKSRMHKKLRTKICPKERTTIPRTMKFS